MSSPYRTEASCYYVVDRTLCAKTHELKEYTIGLAGFDRPEQFDPRIDPIVRVEAGRLRRKVVEILTALSPHHGLAFFLRHGLRGALILGSVVLVVTGGEALYADIAAASASGLGVRPGLIGERLHRTDI
jgi:hypothetical protein